MDDVGELERAVEIALAGAVDGEMKQQALAYCSELRDSPRGWCVALALLAEPNRQPTEAARFFASQILDLAIPKLNSDDLNTVKEGLLAYLAKPAAALPSAEPRADPVHLRNKLAQTLAQLYVATYRTQWSSFFVDLSALAQNSERLTDLYLRVLKAVHEEIGDTLIIRDAETVARNNTLKDQIRVNDAPSIALFWRSTLEACAGRSDSRSQELSTCALQAIAGWVSWMDLSLVIGENGELVSLLYKQFEEPALRMPALDTVSEIVSKKMPASNKLRLIQLLNLPTLLEQIAQAAENDGDIDLEERLAKSVNDVCQELVLIMDASAGDAVAENAEGLLFKIFPTLLALFANLYDCVTLQVVPCLNEYLQTVRKQVRKAMRDEDPGQGNLNEFGQIVDFSTSCEFVSAERRAVLKAMLEKVIAKSVYDDEAVWEYDEDDDGEDENGEFLDLRRKLKVLQEQIATIDGKLFMDDLATFITTKVSSQNASWQQMELVLYELSVFGEVYQNQVMRSMRAMEPDAQRILLQLVSAMIENPTVSQSSYPPVQLRYFELANQLSWAFGHLPDNLLHTALESFVSPSGLHSSHPRVRVRSWYLFFRLYKAVRKHFTSNDVAPRIFEAILPLLTIEVRPLPPGTTSETAARTDSVFNSQLNLFSLCGILFSNGTQEDGNLTRQFLESLFADASTCVEFAQKETDDNARSTSYIKLHHILVALGSFARGISDGFKGTNFADTPAANELKKAASMLVEVATQMGDVPEIRDAARLTIARLVALLGASILVDVSRLINVLLYRGSLSEMGEFLRFLGQLVHTFRTEAEVFEMFTMLCSPLFAQVFKTIEHVEREASSGSTDSQVECRDLLRQYLALVLSILNNRFGAIFLVDSNLGTLENVVGSLIHYAARADCEIQSQRTAITILTSMVQLWGTGTISEGQFGSGQPVALFAQPEIYTQFTELCFSIPRALGQNLKDAQTRNLIYDLAVLHKTMYDARGSWYAELVESYLIKAGLSTENATRYVSELAQLAPKEFKVQFYRFLSQPQL